MKMETESLNDVFDRAFAGINQVRETFTPQLTPRGGRLCDSTNRLNKYKSQCGAEGEEKARYPAGA